MVAQGDVIVPLRSSGVSHRPVVQVKVKSYDGLELPVDLAESEDDMKILTLRQLKDQIQRLPGNPGTETTLTYGGKRLDSDSKTLGEYGLKPKALIQMVVTVHGGFRDRDTTITSSS
uniref:Ubiquitin-like domain-containing protein n=1 Tax=Oryzias melastigma TaxID=30732 RepID=A0A3B3BS50_ORYME